MSNQKRTQLALLWEERMQQWLASGISLAKWSKQNNLPYSRSIYWKVRLLGAEKQKKNIQEQKGFYEMEFEKKITSGISIDVQEMRIHLETNFDSSTLLQCLELLRGKTC